jgi:DNA-binding transcriptional LysR family regulator
MQYSLRQLQIFKEVARHLSYTRAAEVLHLTQPAVFAQVRQLESQIGHKLIDRLGKTLFLTDAGETVLTTAHAVLAEVENLDMRLAEMQAWRGGGCALPWCPRQNTIFRGASGHSTPIFPA